MPDIKNLSQLQTQQENLKLSCIEEGCNSRNFNLVQVDGNLRPHVVCTDCDTHYKTQGFC